MGVGAPDLGMAKYSRYKVFVFTEGSIGYRMVVDT